MVLQAVPFAVRLFVAIAMMSATVLSVSLTSTSTATAGDFFDDHDSLFRNEELCAPDLAEQVRDFGRFVALYEAVKAETKFVEVVDYGAYATEIEDKSTNERCAIIRHEDCFSAHCY